MITWVQDVATNSSRIFREAIPKLKYRSQYTSYLRLNVCACVYSYVTLYHRMWISRIVSLSKQAMYWRVTCSTPGHCLNLYWFTVKLEPRQQITVILEFKEMHLKMLSAKFRPFYSGLNVMILTLVAWWPATFCLRIRKPLMSYKNRATNHRRHCGTHILGIEIIEFQ